MEAIHNFQYRKQLETNKHLTFFDVFFSLSFQQKLKKHIELPIHLFVQLPNLPWGWAVEQTAATFRSYFRSLDLLQQEMGSFLDFVIPGGALGNTAAAFMAREMGLPLRRLICGVTLGRKCGGSMENEQGIEWKREYLQVLM